MLWIAVCTRWNNVGAAPRDAPNATDESEHPFDRCYQGTLAAAPSTTGDDNESSSLGFKDCIHLMRAG